MGANLDSARFDEILSVLQRLASGEKNVRLPVTKARDSIDALALAVNVVADEMQFQAAELQKAHDAAIAASAAKTAFLANVAHEIRSPMTAIMGFTELLMQHSMDSAQRDAHLMRITRNGAALIRLLEDIVDISRIDSGQLMLSPVPFDVEALLSDVVETFEPQAAGKKIAFRAAIDTPLPKEAVTDAMRLRQVLVNLLSNALKFTKQGVIELRVAWQGDKLECRVIDSGVGVDPKFQALLFQPFQQGAPDTGQRYGGSGLGLALSRRLAEALGGSVVLARSAVNVGSEFRVCIPLSSPSSMTFDKLGSEWTPPSTTQTVEKSLSGLKLLLVEDTADSQLVHTTYLRDAGADVELASDGDEAVASCVNKSFDLVLMDIQMERVDGALATQLLRRLGYRGRIVALTAHAITAEINALMTSGFDEILAKPISRAKLVEAVKRLAQTGRKTAV